MIALPPDPGTTPPSPSDYSLERSQENPLADDNRKEPDGKRGIHGDRVEVGRGALNTESMDLNGRDDRARNEETGCSGCQGESGIAVLENIKR